MNSQFEWDDLEFWRTGEWQVIQERLDECDQKGIEYCPARENLFAAFDATPFEKVKVAIIGQDPYPDPKYATGIAFSIPKNLKKFPPTLENIFDEYDHDLNAYRRGETWNIKDSGEKAYPNPRSGSLTSWAVQGVLLFNSIPTCFSGSPASHRTWWEWIELSREVVQQLSARREGIVFVFWGGLAQKYEQYVDTNKHFVIRSPHPSPLSANRGFFGSRPFTTANGYLKERAIDWKLP